MENNKQIKNDNNKYKEIKENIENIENNESTKSKKNKVKKEKKKPLFYRFCLKIAKKLYKQREYIGVENLPNEPCILVANHSQIHGPLTGELYYIRKKKIWCTWEMLRVREIPKYAYQIFWSKKPKGVRWFYKILSYLIAPFAYFFKKADTLPVYRDNRTIVTIKKTIEALNNGEDVILFPETDDNYNNILQEFHRGFIDIAKFYYKKYKKEINLVPMYNCAELKKVVIGKPIKYDGNVAHEEQIEKICTYLKEEITKLAQSLPEHTVIPFLNLPKEEYKRSK